MNKKKRRDKQRVTILILSQSEFRTETDTLPDSKVVKSVFVNRNNNTPWKTETDDKFHQVVGPAPRKQKQKSIFDEAVDTIKRMPSVFRAVQPVLNNQRLRKQHE